MWRGLALAVACAGFLAGPAEAAPEVVYFDGPGGYGFSDLGSLDPVVTKHFSGDSWQVAADVQFNPDPGDPGQFLLLIDPVEIEWCKGVHASACDDNTHVLEAVWDITLNPENPMVTNSEEEFFDINLFLASWQQDDPFNQMNVGVFYDLASIDGVDVLFQVAIYENTFNFLNLALEAMEAGPGGERRVSVTYLVEGDLPFDEESPPLLLAPFLATAAYMTPVPEPGTALLLSLGLMGIALQRRRHTNQ